MIHIDILPRALRRLIHLMHDAQMVILLDSLVIEIPPLAVNIPMRPPQTILVRREIPQALDLGAIRPVAGIQQVLRAQEAVPRSSVGLEIVAHLEEVLHDLEGAWRGDAERVVDAEAKDEDADGLAFAVGALADRGPRKGSVRIR